MLEAKLDKAELLKKILEAVKELVSDANFDCSEGGIELQAMDNSHVALVSLKLPPSIFEDSGFRCDRNMSLGMNMTSLQKIVKCAGNDDEVTLRADDNGDTIILQFSDKKHDRVGEYEMKLMDIDQEHLGIPDTTYDAHITMPSSEFARIVRDLKDLGESIRIEVSKEGVKFTAEGDIGRAAVTLRPTSGSTSAPKAGSSSRKIKDDEDEPNGNGNGHVKDEDEDKPMFRKDDEEDEDNDEAKVKADEDEEYSEDDDDGPKRKKAKTAATKSKETKSKKKRRQDDDDDSEDESNGVEGDRVCITLTQSVGLTFASKYLNNFARSTPLSSEVVLSMSNEVPLLVKYQFGDGSIEYYLAPKISDDA